MSVHAGNASLPLTEVNFMVPGRHHTVQGPALRDAAAGTRAGQRENAPQCNMLLVHELTKRLNLQEMVSGCSVRLNTMCCCVALSGVHCRRLPHCEQPWLRWRRGPGSMKETSANSKVMQIYNIERTMFNSTWNIQLTAHAQYLVYHTFLC